MPSGLYEQLGFYQQMQQAQNLALQRAQMQMAQQQHGDAMAMQAAQMGQQAYQFEASRQPSSLDVFHAIQQERQQDQQYNQALSLHDAQLTQAEKMRMQRLEQTISDIQTARDNNEISPQDAQDAIVQARTGLDPLARRQAAVQMQAHELQLQQARHLAQFQTTIDNGTAAQRAAALGSRMVQNPVLADGTQLNGTFFVDQHGQPQRMVDPTEELRTNQISDLLRHYTQEAARADQAGTFVYQPGRPDETPAQKAERQRQERQNYINAAVRNHMRTLDNIMASMRGAPRTAPALTQQQQTDLATVTNAIRPGAVPPGGVGPPGPAPAAAPMVNTDVELPAAAQQEGLGRAFPNLQGEAFPNIQRAQRWIAGEQEGAAPLTLENPANPVSRDRLERVLDVVNNIRGGGGVLGLGPTGAGTGAIERQTVQQLLMIRRDRMWTPRERQLFNAIYERNRQSRAIAAQTLATAMGHLVRE